MFVSMAHGPRYSTTRADYYLLTKTVHKVIRCEFAQGNFMGGGPILLSTLLLNQR